MTDLHRRNWLAPADFKRTQDTVPICCVDVVPIRIGASGKFTAVGLILRDVPGERERKWCLVGGRLWRDESLPEGAARQIHETLGEQVRFTLTPDAQPVYVAQYFTHERGLGTVDIRQHAVACTFVVPLEGPTTAMGEAADFRWFEAGSLPPAEEFGFGQNLVLAQCLARFAEQASKPART